VAYKFLGRLAFFSFTRAKYKKGQESCREKLLEKRKEKENQFMQSPTPTGNAPDNRFLSTPRWRPYTDQTTSVRF